MRSLEIDKAGGEVADWSRLVARLCGSSEGGVVVVSSLLARAVTWICRAEAVTLGSRVLLSGSGARGLARLSNQGLLLLAHELAHVAQFRRIGCARFLAAYLWEYLGGRRRGLSHRRAYLEISFEREARRVERTAAGLLAAGALLRG